MQILTFGDPMSAGDDSESEVAGELRNLLARRNLTTNEVAALPIVIQFAGGAQNL